MNTVNLEDGISQLATQGNRGGLVNVQEAYALPPREPNIGDYWRILLKRKWTVISAIFLVITVAAIASWRWPKSYDSTSRIAISHQIPNILDFKDANHSGVSGDEELSIDTEVKILQSDSLALQVIRNMSLDQAPDFAGPLAIKTNR